MSDTGRPSHSSPSTMSFVSGNALRNGSIRSGRARRLTALSAEEIAPSCQPGNDDAGIARAIDTRALNDVVVVPDAVIDVVPLRPTALDVGHVLPCDRDPTLKTSGKLLAK